MIECKRSAVFTEDRKNRLVLKRDEMQIPTLKGPTDRIVFLLNNPSNADAEQEDATSRRGLGFTAHWGYRNMWFVNTNCHISTDPKCAEIPNEETLLQNDEWILRACAGARGVIAAWGSDANPILAARALKLARFAGKVYALRVNKDGTPGHILYLPKNLRPVIYNQETT